LRAVRLEPADAAQIEDISLVLGLSSGEFLRRSIRVGIKALRRARLPGSPVAGPVQREQLQLNLKEGK
jgi:hypothetical protein